MVEILSLAHERACEAQLAVTLTESLAEARVPDLAMLRALYAPDSAALPNILVKLPALSSYESLLATTAGKLA